MKKHETLLKTIIGGGKVAAFFVLILLFVLGALVFKIIPRSNPFFLSRFFYQFLLRILEIRVRIFGTPAETTPILFVANHVSYLDIPVLGALLSASFIAKAEVAAWPLFGFLAKLQNTVFIERRSIRAAAQRTQLQDHLATKRNLILFPEGTSSDGLTVLPFKSSLFSIIEESDGFVPLSIQPVSMTCSALDGFPLLREQRPLYAWYGDMTLLPHLWHVFKHGHFTVDVVFHHPLPAADHPNRKELSSLCQSLVAQGVEESLTGRGES